MKLRFYPFDIEYKTISDKPVIHLYGKTAEGKKICITDNSFEPYLWAIPKTNITDLERELKTIKIEGAEIVRTEIHKKNNNGKEQACIKIFTKLPSHVPIIKNYLEAKRIQYAEADILFSRRYLIDREIIPFQEYAVEVEEEQSALPLQCYKLQNMESSETTLNDHRLLSVDIESYPTKDRSFNSPILMIAIYGKDYKKVICWKHFNTNLDYVEFVSSEAELLERFRQIIEKEDPDILTGYFTDGYDFPMILERAKKYKIKLDFGLDRSEIKLGRGQKTEATITGIPHLDIFNLHKNLLRQGLKTDDLKLGSVAKELLGETKTDENILELGDAWDKNDAVKLSRFCEYNLQDSKITYNLADKMMPAIIELIKIVGLPLDDASRMSVSQLVEYFLIKNEAKYNEIAPNRPTSDEIKRREMMRLKGAFVFEPTPGLYKNIIVFDFRSLYPTIIASHNLSGATLNCECCSDTESVPIEGAKMWFCKKRKGFLPSMIEDLIVRRMRVKEMMKEKTSPFLKARELGLKLLALSFYGYLAFYGSRWYSFESGNATTAYARYYIKKVIGIYQQHGFKVIYSDTDSVFTLFNDERTKDDAIRLMETINKDLPGLMELEYDGTYPAGIFVATQTDETGAKKKYALIDEDDHIVIKGFATVRRNTAQIAKEVQRKVLGIILKEHNPDKAFNYVKETISKIRKHELPISDFVIKTKITKELEVYEAQGPHVAVAQRLKEQGYNIGAGSMIEYVITESGDKIRDKAREIDAATKDEIDAEYYISNQIIPNIDKIFEVLGFDAKSLLDKDQQSLGRFF